MALEANALTTLATFKDYIGAPVADTSKDSRYELFINFASGVIETYCERIFWRKTHTERHDGRLSDTLVTRQWPILSVVEMRASTSWDFTDANTIIDPGDYAIENESVIRLRSRLFGRGNLNIQVEYQAGWITPGNAGANLPKELEMTCLQLAEFYLTVRDDRRVGVTSKSKNTESISYLTDIPDYIKIILDNYSRTEFGAGLSASVTNG